MGLFSKRSKDVDERSFYPVNNALIWTPIKFNGEENPTVRACIEKIASTMASLPIHLYTHVKGGGKVLAVGNPVFEVIERPAYQESNTLFWHTLVSALLYTGNAFAFIHRGKNGQPIGLSLIDSRNVIIQHDEDYHTLYNVNGKVHTAREILHIPGLWAYNGVQGFSPISLNKGLVDLDNELLAYIQKYFNNSIGSRQALKLDKDLANGRSGDLEKLYQTLIPNLNKFVVGAQNAGKMMVLPPGTDLQESKQTSNAESDLRSLLDMLDRQICTMFNIPYEIINSSASKYNSLESKERDFLAVCIKPLGDHIAETLRKQLCDPLDTALFVEWNYKSMISTNTNDLINALSKELQSGLLTLNEARAKLGESPIEGKVGDTYFVPANLAPLTDEYISAYMAKNKIAMAESEHNQQGDNI